MSNIDKQALREELSNPAIGSNAHLRKLALVLLDELEAAEKRIAELEDAEKKTVEMPTFDGYVPHVARELQAAFRIACDNAGINIAAAGKGE